MYNLRFDLKVVTVKIISQLARLKVQKPEDVVQLLRRSKSLLGHVTKKEI